MNMTTQSEKVKRIAELLLKKFPSLTMIDAVKLAHQILERLDD